MCHCEPAQVTDPYLVTPLSGTLTRLMNVRSVRVAATGTPTAARCQALDGDWSSVYSTSLVSSEIDAIVWSGRGWPDI